MVRRKHRRRGICSLRTCHGESAFCYAHRTRYYSRNPIRPLSSYDDVSTNFRYRCLVADAILQADARVALPQWLLQLFKNEASAEGGGRDPQSFARSNSNIVALLQIMVSWLLFWVAFVKH